MQRSGKFDLNVRPSSLEGPQEDVDCVSGVSVHIWCNNGRVVYSLETSTAALDATATGVTPPRMVARWVRTCRCRILRRKVVRHCATSSAILLLASRLS